MSLIEEQCKKVCRILDTVLANRPIERDYIIVAVREAFKALAEPHWIPVTERLPDVGVDGEIEILGYEQLAIADSTFKISNPVLATRKIDDRYELAVLQWEVDGNDRKYWVNDGGSIIKGVTAWMPLPEPYKGEVTE